VAWLIALLAVLPEFSGYVVDRPGAIGREEAARIGAVCARLDKARVAQIAVAAVDDLEGMDRKEYAVELFRKWKLGHGAKADDGLLILIVPGPPGHRGVKVEVGYGLEGILPDGKVGAILDELATAPMREGRYGAAAAALVERFAAEIEKAAPAPAARVKPPADLLHEQWAWALVALDLLLLVLYLVERQPGIGAALATLAALGIGIAGARGVGWLGFAVLLFPLPFLGQQFWRHRCRKDGAWLKDEKREVVKAPQPGQYGIERITQVCPRCGFTRAIEVAMEEKASFSLRSGKRVGRGAKPGDQGGGSGFKGGEGGRSGGGGADREY
jgi:uncharacterized membrane protein YgcG